MNATRTRVTTVLLGITATTLTGISGAAAAPTAAADSASIATEPSDPPSRGDSLPDQRSLGSWPAELTEHTRLFVNPYRSYLVELRDGVPTLVLSTGWDSCWMMTQHHGVRQYPC